MRQSVTWKNWFVITKANTTFNTAVTATASEILGKHHQKKKPWVTAGIPALCNKRRELRKKRFEPEGYDKYKEVNNSIKRCRKKRKKKKKLDRRTV